MILGMHLDVAVLAGAASWLVGVLWYALLGRGWLEALEPGAAPGGLATRPFAFVAACVMATVIGIVTGGVTGGHPNVEAGLIVAFILWFGCVFTTVAVTHARAGRSARLTLVDAGHWLLAMLAAGAVIGAFPMD